MRNHRVWTSVSESTYASSKDFGGEFRASISVGSSSDHSGHLGSIEVREESLDGYGEWSVFYLYACGHKVAEKFFNQKTKTFSDVHPSKIDRDRLTIT
jgi:hypothetical protein